jgi:hypothetical protein
MYTAVHLGCTVVGCIHITRNVPGLLLEGNGFLRKSVSLHRFGHRICALHKGCPRSYDVLVHIVRY